MKDFNNMSVAEYYEEIAETFPEDERTLARLTSVNGFTKKVIDDFIYWVSGYRSLEQYLNA